MDQTRERVSVVGLRPLPFQASLATPVLVLLSCIEARRERAELTEAECRVESAAHSDAGVGR
ncbi:hypothetical protein Taro_055109, partial [Colocasia esculenta]|nr:hypothetical protein [Colocasia esculenta]